MAIWVRMIRDSPAWFARRQSTGLGHPTGPQLCSNSGVATDNRPCNSPTKIEVGSGRGLHWPSQTAHTSDRRTSEIFGLRPPPLVFEIPISFDEANHGGFMGLRVSGLS
jgi:hypothetical protein